MKIEDNNSGWMSFIFFDHSVHLRRLVDGAWIDRYVVFCPRLQLIKIK